MQVLCLGSKYQLLKVNIQDVPVPSTSARIVDSSRDLRVVINSGLSMSNNVAAVCRSVYYHAAASATNDFAFVVRRCQEDAHPANVQPTYSKCIQNTRANAGRLLNRVNTL